MNIIIKINIKRQWNIKIEKKITMQIRTEKRIHIKIKRPKPHAEIRGPSGHTARWDTMPTS